MPLTYPRKNGKPTQAFIDEGVAMYEGLEEVAAKYRPTLEGLGILDGLHAYQEVMLFVWLWKHDKEIDDAARGIISVDDLEALSLMWTDGKPVSCGRHDHA
jgi:hypothetical protein